MNPRIIFISLVLIIITGIGGWFFLPSGPDMPANATLRFHAYIGDEPLTINDFKYANPGGEGQYKVNAFQLFISNILLAGDGKNHTVADSYHLLRFGGESPYFDIDLPAIDVNAFEEIRWGIGIDPEANGTLKIAGDLDPNNRMAWNWQTGYKFVLFEGRLETGDMLIPLVYHVGFDENYTRQFLPLSSATPADMQCNIRHFKLDISKLFYGAEPLDMAALSSVKFDPTDSKRIAKGFGQLISNHPDRVGC